MHFFVFSEISNGKVLFLGNPFLGYINTIDWEPILRGRQDAAHFQDGPYNESGRSCLSGDRINGRLYIK